MSCAHAYWFLFGGIAGICMDRLQRWKTAPSLFIQKQMIEERIREEDVYNNRYVPASQHE